MQDMVKELNEILKQDKNAHDEKDLFESIVRFLENTTDRPVDLEAVFSVVDSIANWSSDRINIPTLFSASRKSNKMSIHEMKTVKPIDVNKVYGQDVIETAKQLKNRFIDYVQSACEINEDTHVDIERYFQFLFTNVANHWSKVGGVSSYGTMDGGLYCKWPIFTTNYDVILETYWEKFAQREIITGFEPNGKWNRRLLQSDDLRLYKLHGSLCWWQDQDGKIQKLQVIPKGGKKASGEVFKSQVMIYPIEEKQLYLDPYVCLFERLNYELKKNDIWIVIGYSFGDQVISNVFEEESNQFTKLIIVGPHAKDISKRLPGFKGTIYPIQFRFADGDAAKIPDEISQYIS